MTYEVDRVIKHIRFVDDLAFVSHVVSEWRPELIVSASASGAGGGRLLLSLEREE